MVIVLIGRWYQSYSIDGTIFSVMSYSTNLISLMLMGCLLCRCCDTVASILPSVLVYRVELMWELCRCLMRFVVHLFCILWWYLYRDWQTDRRTDIYTRVLSVIFGEGTILWRVLLYIWNVFSYWVAWFQMVSCTVLRPTKHTLSDRLYVLVDWWMKMFTSFL